MCNEYSRTKGYRDYVDGFASHGLPIRSPEPHQAPNLAPQPSVRPTDPGVIFRRHDDGLEMATARWWLVPWWHKGTLKEFKLATFNARMETLTTTRAFKDAFARRRCLVPADGWFEFTGPKGDKTRWSVTAKDGDWMCFAGLWERCNTSDQGWVESFTIVMQPAGAPLNAYHDRAPVVLPREHWATWLDLDADVMPLLGPESPDGFVIRQEPREGTIAGLL